MAVFDTIGIIMASASLLAFIALVGFIVLKVGFTSFKIVMEPVMAARGIENIEGIVRNSKYGITEEDKDEFEIISSFINAEIRKNPYTNYLYKLFKIEIIIVHIDSLISSINTKIENIVAHLDSFKSSVKARIKKSNHTKYAYIQLFKK